MELANAQLVEMTEWRLLLAVFPVGFCSAHAHLVQCGFGVISGLGDLKCGTQGLDKVLIIVLRVCFWNVCQSTTRRS